MLWRPVPLFGFMYEYVLQNLQVITAKDGFGRRIVRIEVGRLCRTALFGVPQQIDDKRHQSGGVFPIVPPLGLDHFKQFVEGERVGVDSEDSGKLYDQFINRSSSASMFFSSSGLSRI